MRDETRPLMDAVRGWPPRRQVVVGVGAVSLVAHFAVTFLIALVTVSPGLLYVWQDAVFMVFVIAATLGLGLWVRHVWFVAALVAVLLAAYAVSLLLRMGPQEGWDWILRAAKPSLEVIAAAAVFSAYLKRLRPRA